LKKAQLFENIETAEISPEQFRTELRKVFEQPVSDEMLDNAWNAMLQDFPTQRIELLQMLKNQFRTFLLSNTNIIHYEAFNKILANNFFYSNLSPLFERDYYSFSCKLRKPDSRIYQSVLTENNLQPTETLFIDDNYENVEAAAKLGIKTHWLQKNETILEIFENFRAKS